MGAFLTLGVFGGWSPPPLSLAQSSLRVQDAWKQVYQQLPTLPLENQYVSLGTGKVNPNDTLVGRLIRYHLYVKGRPAQYRLDWKLTLADYLEANELMIESAYPGEGFLTINPMVGDRAAIRRLNRAQRDALVQVLVNTFNLNRPSTPINTPVPSPSHSPSPVSTPSLPGAPRPGDAHLLLP
ncbi:hypothetical protein [Neosynechococcus sphagnicola]|nr:hypothetical protein [Neosynechococcus sphagnicola]